MDEALPDARGGHPARRVALRAADASDPGAAADRGGLRARLGAGSGLVG